MNIRNGVLTLFTKDQVVVARGKVISSFAIGRIVCYIELCDSVTNLIYVQHTE